MYTTILVKKFQSRVQNVVILLNTHFESSFVDRTLLKKNYVLDVLLLGVVAAWGANFAVVKYSMAEISPMAFNSMRFLLAIVVMWILFFQRGHHITLEKKDVGGMIGLGLLGNFVYQIAFILGLEWSTAANASVISGAGPVYIALMAHFVFGEKVNKLQFFGIAAGFMGVLLIILGKQSTKVALGSGVGELLLFVASICWAMYSLLSRKYMTRYKPLDLAVFSMTSGGLAIALAGLPWLIATDFTSLGWGTWLGVLFSGGISIGLSYIIWNYGLNIVGAVRTSVYQNFIPVFGILFSYLLLKERLTAIQFTGAAMVISGVFVTRFFKK